MRNPYKIEAVKLIRDRNFWHFYIIACIFVFCSLFYYLGEVLDYFNLSFTGLEYLYTVHDLHRLLFVIPVIYAGYIFRVSGAVVTTALAFLIFLPRALFISPYPDPFLRMFIFTVGAGIMGFLVAKTRNANERKEKLEKTIHTERDILYGILQRMKDGVIIVGPDYKVNYLNPAMISEFGNGMGMYCYGYLHGLASPCEGPCRIKGVLGGKTERWEYTYSDGRTYEIIASPFVDNADIVSELAIFRNITQRKQLEMELRNLNELKSDLLSNVSHELRSPLTSIKGIISSLLQKDIHWDEETKQMLLSGISEETDRLSSLVTNLLNMSKLEAGAWQPDLEACHIENVITDTVEHQKWISKSHSFVLNMNCTLPEVYMDSNQIKQVINNLLENAQAYSPEGSIITVTVSQKDNEIIVEVSDEGEGITESDKNIIFEMFHRGSQCRLKPGGVGLGLSICKSIIEAHDGRIGVKSEIGRGSIFYFSLPVKSSNISSS